MSDNRLQRRVTRAADEALVKQRLVTALDVLIGLGWLHPTYVDLWRQGRVSDLEQLVQIGPDRVAQALVLLHDWATARGLEPIEGAYPARSRGHESLRFTAGGEEPLEQAFRIQWLSPKLTDRERERERLLKRRSRPPELVVIQPLKNFTCAVCGTEDEGLLLMQDTEPTCMSCADMGHLVCSSPRVTRHSPGGRRPPAASGRWWCASAARADATNGRGSSSRSRRSRRRRWRVSQTRMHAPSAASESAPAGSSSKP